MSLGEVLKKVEITNGGGPKFTIPLGIVVLALAGAQVYSQTQMWTIQAHTEKNSEDVAGLVLLQREDAERIRTVEEAVVVMKANQEADAMVRRELLREWHGLGQQLKEAVKGP